MFSFCFSNKRHHCYADVIFVYSLILSNSFGEIQLSAASILFFRALNPLSNKSGIIRDTVDQPDEELHDLTVLA